MAAKKKSTKTSTKKAAKKKAAKKKAAVKKKAAKKVAVKKKAVKKKAAARKKTATPKRKAAPKKRAAKQAAAEPEAPVEDEAVEDTPVEDTPVEDAPVEVGDTSAPIVNESTSAENQVEEAPPPRRRRRSRIIPPLPDEEDEFVPFEEAPVRETAASARGTSPDEILAKVRAGDLHVSAMDEMDDGTIRTLARRNGLRLRRRERRQDTIYRLLGEPRRGRTQDDRQGNRGRAPEAPRQAPERREPEPEKPQEKVHAEGLLEMHPDGYGFLRKAERSYQQHPTDVYVSVGLIRKHHLQAGHWITGYAEQPNVRQPQLALKTLDQVNHGDPARLEGLTPFEKLTVVYPDQRFVLETEPEDMEMRVIDLFCPLGLGQRGLIVAPPRTGKTVLLTKLADAIAINSPQVDIVVLLVDERPEEVTNMRRSVKGEVVASTFDKPAGNHVRVAELVVEKVKRMVEFGRDVVLLLDSITRMGRAYNNQTGGSGRLLSGGLDANALSKPKRFFGSARNVEHGGSLTIVATALIDTGSKMDEVIFEEFKGTGNMEIVLNREMANNRVWPAIDLPSSGTRNEDLLLHPDELRRVTMLRRGITGQDPITVMTALTKQLKLFSTNGEFLLSLGN